jgi:glycosyltransferase involved in cell wall biosynthesis
LSTTPRRFAQRLAQRLAQSAGTGGRVMRRARRLYGQWKAEGTQELFWRMRTIYFGAMTYRRWLRKWDVLDAPARAAIGRHVAAMADPPLFSIITPVYDPPEQWLRRCIESVRSQLYPHWELCLADDLSRAPHVRAVLEEYRLLDSRIKVCYRSENGHISAASNSALALATGQFCILLDHDDELTEQALYLAAAVLQTNPELDLLYSDEDKIDEKGRRFGPYFKPDWNPQLLTGQNMVSHMGVYRTALLREVGGFRLGHEGSQDWDLVLRVTERTRAARIHHIPQVLYHWRAIAGSTAVNHAEKPYASQAATRVLSEHFARLGEAPDIRPGFGSYFRAVHRLPSPLPLISIVIACADKAPAVDFVGRLKNQTDHAALEIIGVTRQGAQLPGADLHAACCHGHAAGLDAVCAGAQERIVPAGQPDHSRNRARRRTIRQPPGARSCLQSEPALAPRLAASLAGAAPVPAVFAVPAEVALAALSYSPDPAGAPHAV